MSFSLHTPGQVFAPGWFLADNENVTRVSTTVKQEGVTPDTDGSMVVPMGTVYPSNDENAQGILYEDVDVTAGDAAGSLVVRGFVYQDRLAGTIQTAAKTALQAKGITFVSAPHTTRPGDYIPS